MKKCNFVYKKNFSIILKSIFLKMFKFFQSLFAQRCMVIELFFSERQSWHFSDVVRQKNVSPTEGRKDESHGSFNTLPPPLLLFLSPPLTSSLGPVAPASYTVLQSIPPRFLLLPDSKHNLYCLPFLARVSRNVTLFSLQTAPQWRNIYYMHTDTHTHSQT